MNLASQSRMKKQRRSPLSAARSANFPPFCCRSRRNSCKKKIVKVKIKIDCNSGGEVVVDEDDEVVVDED